MRTGPDARAQRTVISTRRLRASATPSGVGTRSSRLPRPTATMRSGGDAPGDQEVPDALGPAEREGVVELVGADGIGVARHREVGRRPRGDRDEDLVHEGLRVWRELVRPLDEVEDEGHRTGRRSRQGVGKEGPDLVGGRLSRLQPAPGASAGARVRRVQHDLAPALLHDHRPHLAVAGREEHDEVGAGRWRGGRWRLGSRAAAPAGRRRRAPAGRRRRRRARPPGRGRRGGAARRYGEPSLARTTSSVPRTPRIAAGVLMRIASGACLAMRPETTASVPLLSIASSEPDLTPS